jgi:hypothetical protein
VVVPGPVRVDGVDFAPPITFSATDNGGQAGIDLQAKPDPGLPSDPEQRGLWRVRVSPADNTLAISYLFPRVPRDIADFLATMPRRTATMDAIVVWHERERCTTFTDGEWNGTAQIQGALNAAGAELRAVGGEITFRIVVSGGKVVDGEVYQSTDLEGTLVDRNVTAQLVGRARPGGTGLEVTFEWYTGSIDLNIDGLPTISQPMPQDGRGKFSPSAGDCTTLTGDMFTFNRDEQNTFPGLTSTLTAPFTATRTR